MYIEQDLQDILTQEDIEILQEIMNIAFGKSAADLAEVINAHVLLSIPFIKMIDVEELGDYIKVHVKNYKRVSIIEQKFWGRFKGDAVLVFSSGAGKELISLLQNDYQKHYYNEPFDILERETLIEVGNILIGACVGKLAELLRDVVTYTPPKILVERDYDRAVLNKHYTADKRAIVLKTDFSFDIGNVSGFLFLVTSNESVFWLKDALQNFLEQYE